MSILVSRAATPLTDALHHTRQTRRLVEELIEAPERLGPEFTVIRRLADPGSTTVTGDRLGWKANRRGESGAGVGDTAHLLAEAKRLGLVERLDWAFRCRTFDIATAAGLDGELHLTPEPETFCSPCPPRLAVSFLRGRRSLAVVAELHEVAFEHERALRTAVEQMRSWGWQFSYADLSGTPAEARAIDLVESIRPAYQQVDVRGEPSPALLAASRAAGASVLAVGLDHPAGLERAYAAGATWARGDLVGRPTRRPV